MFLKDTTRFKDGKEHHYWSLVENRRVDGGRKAWSAEPPRTHGVAFPPPHRRLDHVGCKKSKGKGKNRVVIPNISLQPHARVSMCDMKEIEAKDFLEWPDPVSSLAGRPRGHAALCKRGMQQ